MVRDVELKKMGKINFKEEPVEIFILKKRKISNLEMIKHMNKFIKTSNFENSPVNFHYEFLHLQLSICWSTMCPFN